MGDRTKCRIKPIDKIAASRQGVSKRYNTEQDIVLEKNAHSDVAKRIGVGKDIVVAGQPPGRAIGRRTGKRPITGRSQETVVRVDGLLSHDYKVTAQSFFAGLFQPERSAVFWIIVFGKRFR